MSSQVRWAATGEVAFWLTAYQAGAQQAAPLQKMGHEIGIEVRR